MSIRIITHCWAKDLPQYAQFLRFQISSLVLYKPKVDVSITVCYSEEDQETTKVLRDMLCHATVKDLGLRVINLSPSELGRRCIGRNKAALASTEDIVWFADVDMVFREGCLDTLYTWWIGERPKGTVMVYPKTIKIHRNHALGDKAVEQAKTSNLRWIDINPDDFVEKKYTRAIGGVQIVDGKFTRLHGYLDESSKWQQPRTDGKYFGDFRDDIIYRSFCSKHGRIEGISLPGVYRLRHTNTSYQ